MFVIDLGWKQAIGREKASGCVGRELVKFSGKTRVLKKIWDSKIKSLNRRDNKSYNFRELPVVAKIRLG